MPRERNYRGEGWREGGLGGQAAESPGTREPPPDGPQGTRETWAGRTARSRWRAPTGKGQGAPGQPRRPRGDPEPASSGSTGPLSQAAGTAMVSTSWPVRGLWVSLRPQHPRPRPRALQATLSNPHSLGEEEKEMKTGKAKAGDTPLSMVPPMDGPRGQPRGQPRPRRSLGRGRRAGLLLP